jgi:hypothetical protein
MAGLTFRAYTERPRIVELKRVLQQDGNKQ